MTAPGQTLSVNVVLKRPHPEQMRFVESPAKRKVIRAGRRGGKTIGAAIMAVKAFAAGRRVLYAAPTTEQVGRFWSEVTLALQELIASGAVRCNNTEHIIEFPNTERRIRAKTAWNADTLRGDYADLLILDEWQLMDETAWTEVGAPMMLDHDGDAIFIYTPPSLNSRSISKARDPQHARKLYKQAQADTTGRWAAFHFSSMANPHLSKDALSEIAKDMTPVAYRQEILAEEVDQAPGALWNRDIIEKYRVTDAPELTRIAVGVDPNITGTGAEAGIVVGGISERHYYTLDDVTTPGGPNIWARAAVAAYYRWQANVIVAESNQGGDMVALTIHQIDDTVPVELVSATRSKHTRAEPVAAIDREGRGHMVGSFPLLEDELVLWTPGDPSPNRLDAFVWMRWWLLKVEPESSTAGELLKKCVR